MSVSLADKVRFLRSAAAHPGAAGAVEVEETHMSWVFLAGDRVYKLKKPVRYPFLDFRALDARERNCREEVRLNRRLAGGVYLGVVPLTRDASGGLALGGAGEVVDWLVEMRRLPRARMLDRAIEDGSATRRDIRAVADLLVEFYRGLPSERIPAAAYVGQFSREQNVTEDVLLRSGFRLDGTTLARALARARRGLAEDAPLLQARAGDGRVVEGHGDLRPEHVCLTDPPVVFDCLEFSRDLRLVDPFDELTFLALECRLLGDGWIGPLLVEACARGLGERPPAPVLEFYWAYRACLRARLALAHLLEPEPRHPEKWLPLAERYLRLAAEPELTPGLPADR